MEHDAHDLQWAISRLYLIAADFATVDTATSRNDAKAIAMVLEEIKRSSITLAAVRSALSAVEA